MSAASVQFAAAKDSPADLVKAAVTAEGGADALKSLKGLAVKGTAKHWEPGQSYKADGEPRFLGDTAFTVDGRPGQAPRRLRVDRAMIYPPPVDSQIYRSVTPTLGFVTATNGQHGGLRHRVAAQLREFERSSPTLLLKAMDDAKNLCAAGTQKLGEASLSGRELHRRWHQIHHPVRSQDAPAGGDPHPRRR